jgi:hypothetical protein
VTTTQDEGWSNIYYKRDGTPAASMDEAMREFEKDRVVARTILPNGYYVSTIFLPINHAFMPDAKPIIFETMVFAPRRFRFGFSFALDEACERYCTEDEAKLGHLRMCEEAGKIGGLRTWLPRVATWIERTLGWQQP